MLSGRITKGIGGLYTVATPDGTYRCNVRGIFRKQKLAPAIGDFVGIDEVDTDTREATIVRIEERKNSLVRPRVANVDQAVIVFAVANPALNADLLDRFLLTAENSGVAPVICFNKVDLLNAAGKANFDSAFCRVYEAIGYPVYRTCAATGEGLDALKAALACKVSVFAGPSGAGKSSLVNMILPGAQMETGELSRKIQRGKHTTRHAELLEAFPGSFIVDSPGFTTVSTDVFNHGNLPVLFREFAPYAGLCRFNDCKHLREPDCAVKAQIGHTIAPARYERYAALMLAVSSN